MDLDIVTSPPYLLSRGQILGRNWDKNLKSFPPCYSVQSHLYKWSLLPQPLLSKSGLELVLNVNIVYGNLMSETLKIMDNLEHAHKPQRNCTVMNSASGPQKFLWTGAAIMHLTECCWFLISSGWGGGEGGEWEGENKSICPHQKPYARGRINHRCINSCCGSCSEYSLKPDPGFMTVQAILILKLYSIL